MKINSRGFEAVAFDFDGVLANTHPVFTNARIAAFEAMADVYDDARFSSISRKIHDDAFRQGADSFTITAWVLEQGEIIKSAQLMTIKEKRLVELALKLRQKHYQDMATDGVDAHPGAIEAVVHAAEQTGGKVAIVTTAASQTEVQPFLKKHGLSDLFDGRIIDRGMVGDDLIKPHPHGYNIAQEQLGVTTADRMLAIEDSGWGIVAANKSGATSVCVASTYTMHQIVTWEGHMQPRVILPNLAMLEKVHFTRN